MLTELDAINSLLAARGLQPIAELQYRHPSVRPAKVKLDEVNVAVQSLGAWYNKSKTELRPTTDGSVYIPQKAVRFTPLHWRDRNRYVLRGSRLFDLEDRTYDIGKTVRGEMVEVLDFEDTPVPARQMIVARAVYEYYLNNGGQEPKLSSYRADMQRAEFLYRREELANTRPQAQPAIRRFRGNITRHLGDD